MHPLEPQLTCAVCEQDTAGGVREGGGGWVQPAGGAAGARRASPAGGDLPLPVNYHWTAACKQEPTPSAPINPFNIVQPTCCRFSCIHGRSCQQHGAGSGLTAAPPAMLQALYLSREALHNKNMLRVLLPSLASSASRQRDEERLVAERYAKCALSICAVDFADKWWMCHPGYTLLVFVVERHV